MRIVLDSNILVHRIIRNQEDPEVHPRVTAWWDARIAEGDHFYVARHTLAETYAVLQDWMGMSPPNAFFALRQVKRDLAGIIPLTTRDYEAALNRHHALKSKPSDPKVRGAMIYDLLVVQAARKRWISRIATVDRHFRLF